MVVIKWWFRWVFFSTIIQPCFTSGNCSNLESPDPTALVVDGVAWLVFWPNGLERLPEVELLTGFVFEHGRPAETAREWVD